MKFPIYKQSDEANCGPTCIKMLLKYHHIDESMNQIKKICHQTSQGVSVYGMIHCFKQYSIEAKSYQCTLEQLVESNLLPCIVHIIIDKLHHYVILKEVKKDYCIVIDPAKGKVTYTIDEFKDVFSQVAICIIQVGNTNKGSKELTFLSFYKQYFGMMKYQICKVTGLSIVTSMLGIISSFYFQYVVDYSSKLSLLKISLLTIGCFLMHLIKIKVEYFRKCIEVDVGLQTKEMMQKKAIQNFLYHSYFDIKNQQQGAILNKIQMVEVLSEFVSKVFTFLFIDGVFLLLITGTIIWYDPVIGLWVIFYQIGFSLLGIYHMKHLEKTNEQILSRKDQLQQVIVELLTNFQPIKQYRCTRFMKEKIEYTFEKLQQSTKIKELIVNKVQTILEAVIQFNMTVVLLFCCYFLSIQKITIGEMMVLYMLVQYTVEPTLSLVVLYVESIIQRTHFQRYLTLLPGMDKKKKKIGKVQKIEFDFVSYSYGYTQDILTNVSCKITSSMHLQGAVGDGKTTFLQLIMNYDTVTKGQIRINDIPIEQIQTASLYKQIIYLSKEPIFFQETLRYNLLLDDPTKEQQMIELLRYYQLNELESKLDYPLDPAGSMFSSGQQQLLLLIRAFLIQPSVLLLDEACSNLDQKHSDLVKKYLEKYARDHILIIVDHQTKIVNNDLLCAIIKDKNIVLGE